MTPELRAALKAGEAAAAVLSERPGHVEHKGAIDLVTDIDRRSEEAVRAVLAVETPDIPVLGEEGDKAEDAPVRWIVDPLDGTTNFVHGFPFYACSIGLEAHGVLEAGVVLDMARGRVFQAARGHGAFCDGERLRVSQTPSLDAALVATGFPYDRRERLDELLASVRAALAHTRGIRRAGAASLDLCFVAAGAIDAFWEHGLGPWDVAAGVLMVREAGGRVTSLDGLAGLPTSPLATNGRLHGAFGELLSAAGAV